MEMALNSKSCLRMGKDVTVILSIPDCKVHGANMGPTWVLSAPDGPHVGPMDLTIRDVTTGDDLETQGA